MPDPIVRLGPLVASTFTVFLVLGAVATFALLGWRTRSNTSVGHVADLCLGVLIGAAVGGRLAHVVINWSYFGFHSDEIFRLSAGGIDWHGAVIGGLLGLIASARWRKVPVTSILDHFTLALPLLAMAGWYGCWAADCGYGLEVDTLARYPSWAVAETPDVYGIAAPRYNTQLFGLGLAGLTLLLAAGLMTIRPLRGARFWVILALLSAEMFSIGFIRGDFAPMLAGLRLDQWLDFGLITLSVVAIVGQLTAQRHSRPSAAHPS